MKAIGILVNGVEFIPMNIVEQHIPFAVPPGQDVQTVYIVPEVFAPDDATRPKDFHTVNALLTRVKHLEAENERLSQLLSQFAGGDA